MPWVKIDDGFARHPKVAEAGPLAMAMQVAALCYSNRELTDGFIPRSVARTLLDFQYVDAEGKIWSIDRGCGMHGETVTAESVIDMLVWVGMWEQVDGGFQIHDYAEYQPTKDEVIREREQGAKRQKDWRDRHRNAVTTPVTNAASNGPVTDAPYPVPVSRTQKTKTEKIPSVSTSPRQKYSADFDAFWTEYPNKAGKQDAWAKWQQLEPAEIVDVIDGLRKWKESQRWKEGFIMAGERWLGKRFWADDPPPDKSANGATNGRVSMVDLVRKQEKEIIDVEGTVL